MEKNQRVLTINPHFYDFLRIHRKYLKEGSYNEMWRIFQSIRNPKFEKGSDYKEVGDYGISLISSILYNEVDEFELIENIIALRKLLGHVAGKIKISDDLLQERRKSNMSNGD